MIDQGQLISLSICLLIALLASWAILAPFFLDKLKTVSEVSEGLSQKEVLMQQLEDLEHDYRTEKLEEDHYRQMKQALVKKIAASV